MALKETLKQKIEEFLVFPGEGSVGIENTFYLSNEGLKQLTRTDDALVVL